MFMRMVTSSIPAPGTGTKSVVARLKARSSGLSHLRRHTPEFLILQCGADGLAGDPMADLRYTPAVHARIARELRALADEMCGGRLMAFGGGGYNPGNVAAAWTNTLTALI
jgi:acetoin utilization protein AcuC